jgi:hypothetical protein
MSNKYRRQLASTDSGVDVYDVLEAFDVRCPARQHAVKKLLCAGARGGKSALTDLEEAGLAVQRAIEMERQRVGIEKQAVAQIRKMADYVMDGDAAGTAWNKRQEEAGE